MEVEFEHGSRDPQTELRFLFLDWVPGVKRCLVSGFT